MIRYFLQRIISTLIVGTIYHFFTGKRRRSRQRKQETAFKPKKYKSSFMNWVHKNFKKLN